MIPLKTVRWPRPIALLCTKSQKFPYNPKENEPIKRQTRSGPRGQPSIVRHVTISPHIQVVSLWLLHQPRFCWAAHLAKSIRSVRSAGGRITSFLRHQEGFEDSKHVIVCKSPFPHDSDQWTWGWKSLETISLLMRLLNFSQASTCVAHARQHVIKEMKRTQRRPSSCDPMLTNSAHRITWSADTIQSSQCPRLTAPLFLNWPCSAP